LLKSLLNVTLFQLLKGQANVINIMIIRWGVLIYSLVDAASSTNFFFAWPARVVTMIE
jgi:hypothetical protein